MSIRTRMNRGTAALAATPVFAACGLLDVSNPNDLVEEDIRKIEAAAAVVNGTLTLVASSVSQSWQPYLVTSDELYWIGSRNAWLSLDQGFIDDPLNEFIDGPFPAMGQARWMSDLAIEILAEHVAEAESDALKAAMGFHLARANFYSGIIYTVIGEIQEDFAFSNKREAGAPVGAENMHTVLDKAIERLSAAITGFQQAGDSDMVLNATAVRARAWHSRAIWDVINPRATGDGMVNSGQAGADAAAVIAAAGGNDADRLFNLAYSSQSTENSMAAWINDRKENQIDLSIVTVNSANDIVGIALKDPIDDVDDPSVIKWLNQWKGGSYLDKGGIYPPLTLASTRMMHIILAENALAGGSEATFTEHVNHIRAMDGLTEFRGQIPNEDMLRHMRRVTVMLQGLRLADMYRWGLEDPKWQGASASVKCPGVMLPVSNIERQANQQDWQDGCS
ncbi:MAG: hypothetical protein OXQ94_03755 [Gemmatimonadota bacterium]|nr:hypothetical protein [Gemmatimonadota bacterium]MDE2870792.1 hypothetical protein [Gemmatimonadota bacterium]